jgi:phosphate transport system substrate-binding protein
MILRTRLLRMAMVPALALGLAAGSAGIASATTTQKGQPKLAAATLNGSGSTLTQAFLQLIIQQFKTVQPNVTVNYGAGGSGKGRQDFANQVVQFAGSDAPYSASGTQPPAPFDYIPTIVSPVTVSYKLSGVSKLQLTADTIAGIFSGAITTWNDPAIKGDNPKANLPSTKITICRRSDSSGTTQNFTTYLQTAAPTKWTLGAAATVSWPAGSVGNNGSTAVATCVAGTDGAVGYIDFSDAKATKGISFASVKNASGVFIPPSVASATAALVGVKLNPDLTYNPLNTKNKAGYPITSPTWLLVYSTQPNAAVGNALKAFLTYIQDNSTKLAPQVDYAPIPPSFQKAALSAIAKIQVG